MDRPLSLLNIGGHPADAFDNCGGTLANHIDRGDRVTVAVMSHGVESHAIEAIEAKRLGAATADLDPTSIADEKEREVVEACGILGLTDVRFLRHSDRLPKISDAIIQQLCDIILDVRPDIVITHHPFESGGLLQGHAECARMAFSAIGLAGSLRSGDDRPPHHVAQIFWVGLHGMTDALDFMFPQFPAILIDITDQVEKKVRALQKIKSQYYGGDLAKKVIECRSGFYGIHLRVPYVEVFVNHLPFVEKHLPVSEHHFRMADESFAKTFAEAAQLIAPFVRDE
jgi:LmbE family N-acetylglucosaminyl deacetylase